MARMLLITRGTFGDIFPFLQLGSALKARGHDVLLFANCHYGPLVERSGLAFAALDSPGEFKHMIEDQSLLNNPRDLVLFYRKYILPKVVHEYEMIREQSEAGDAIIVSNHNSHLTTQIANEKLGVPLLTVSLAPTGITYMLPMFEGMFKVLADEVNQIRAQVGLAPVRDWSGWLWSIERIIGFWPDWFAAAEPGWPSTVIPVGFLLHDESTGDHDSKQAQDILDGREPPILISHGTSIPTDPRFFAVSTEACRLLGRRAILVTSHQDMVPEHLPDGIVWAQYLPFADLMHRVRAVIHHGGIGTLSRALDAAVPQLVLPDGFDRSDNAVRLHRLGVAEFLLPHQWQPEAIAEALRRLDSPVVQDRCQELARRMRAADPAASACETIEQFMANRNPASANAASQANPPNIAEQGREQDSKTRELIERLRDLPPAKRALLTSRLKKMAEQR